MSDTRIRKKNETNGKDDDSTCTLKKDEKMDQKFILLYEKAKSLGLGDKDMYKLDSVKNLKRNFAVFYIEWFIRFMILFLFFLVSFVFVLITEWPVSNEDLLAWTFEVRGLKPSEQSCLIQMHDELGELLRPPLSCGFCKNVHKIEKLPNITKEEFTKFYAYTGRPVVIGKDATKSWTALQVFNFQFFKDLYAFNSTALMNAEKKCQFFPYKTEFNHLHEVFNMSEDRINMQNNALPWYIGWSNCDFSAANTLRSHYQRPHFLPSSAESGKTDWIFMGSKGHGAHMHIDQVDNPSWQAQIAGKKRWTLESPPECYMQCSMKQFSVVMEPGEIIVVDTNRWFHSTKSLGDEISIAIGSEYD